MINNVDIYTKNKTRILIDQDDVLACFNEYLLSIINHVKNTNYTIENVTDWNITKLFNLEKSLEYYIKKDKNFFLNLLPKDNNIDVFKELYLSNKYEIFIVTYVNMRYPKFFHDKIKWIEKHLPFFPIDNVISTRYKNTIVGDYLIDDAPHNINEFTNGTPIIYDMPYNRDLKGIRVNNLRQFKDIYL